jgi:hypothetical protein
LSTDHTIQVGTNKAFIVLGIPLKSMKPIRALTFTGATVLSVTVKKSWTGIEINELHRRKQWGIPCCHSGLAPLNLRYFEQRTISIFYWIPDQVRDDKTPQAAGY